MKKFLQPWLHKHSAASSVLRFSHVSNSVISTKSVRFCCSKANNRFSENRVLLQWVASLKDLKQRNENSLTSLKALKKRAVKFRIEGEIDPNKNPYAFDPEGFCFYEDGQVFAYENSCAHNGMELDMDDADFFTSDGKYIQCKVHGAKFENMNGKCIRGPCKGKALKPLQVI